MVLETINNIIFMFNSYLVITPQRWYRVYRVLKRLGRPEEAMRAFLTALDLDPKDNNLIKVAIDRHDEPEVDEDVSGF